MELTIKNKGQFINKFLTAAPQQEQQIIIAGDFNARLYPTDHHDQTRTMDSHDTQHQTWVHTHHLTHQGSPTAPHPTPRQHTFHRFLEIPEASCSSRIDDILDTLPPTQPREYTTQDKVGGSDHIPLTLTLPSPGLGLLTQISQQECKAKRITNTLQHITATQTATIKKKKRGYAVRRGLRESGHPEKPPLGEV